jgi:hypothetical protein
MAGNKGLTASGTVLLVLSTAFGAAGQHHAHSMKADVHFLATSASFHSKWAESEDVYLAEVAVGKRGALPALLVDQFPDYREPLSREILTAPGGARLRLSRDSGCDIEFAKILPLRSAPGEPTSFIEEKLVFTPQLPPALTPDTILPCYRIVRR